MSERQSMQLRIKHTTGYSYEAGAAASYNEARLTPLTTSDQYVLRSRLEITPTPWTFEYRDYWGSTVTSFEVHDEHENLTVVATSTVETSSAPPDPQAISWADLAGVADELCEYLMQSEWVRPADDLLARLEPIRAGSERPADFVSAVADFLYREIVYQTGSTEVTTVAADAWAARSGVCQDFAHLLLGALRSTGIPARYVSGYLHPSTDPEVGVTVAGESHAWVEWWDGEWVGWDVTNSVAPGERHVVVARGRDYADNPPLRGIYATAGDSEMFVNVEITRLR